jgi:2-polyprenyl-6-methoxyphenol hydroxylase-like FAD-dependent oxidoreductase
MSGPANSKLPILIAGGGIGGLSTALALQQRGFDVIVCERAPELREVGAGLLLSPNAVQVLRLLGLAEESSALSRSIDEWTILNAKGHALHRLNPTRVAGSCALSLHRADLQSILLKHLVPGTVRLGFEVTAFHETNEHVEIVSQSGERLRGVVLIGADGLRSAVRRLALRTDDQLRDCGYTGWRCVVPFVPHGYQGRELTESWGEGKRFGISPLGGDRCYWYATANRLASLHSASATSPAKPAEKDELLRLFGHWHAPITEIISATHAESILVSTIFDRRADMRAHGAIRVTLLGDTAHAMTPNLGQGACAALEDAWILAREYAAASSPVDGLRCYERIRGARSKWVSRASHLMGNVIQLENPALTAVRDTILRLTPSALSELTMRPLFSFRG